MPVSSTRNSSIDPALFFTPEDVIDLRSETRDPNDEEPTEYDPGLDDIDTPTGEGESTSLATPGSLNVVEQSARVSSDGRTLIDVVFEVEDILGALTYELRLAK